MQKKIASRHQAVRALGQLCYIVMLTDLFEYLYGMTFGIILALH